MFGTSNGSATRAAGCFSTSTRRSLGKSPVRAFLPEDAAVERISDAPGGGGADRDAVRGRDHLGAAVEHYRKLGCLIVIDDFGAGFSNFDRIWRLRPDIVKIDREMTRRVTIEPLARRMFTGIISVLREAGALVCVEGIETEAEALCAIDANADLMQGDYFAPGSAVLPPENARSDMFARLIAGHRADFAEFQKRQHSRLVPYLAVLKNAVQDLSFGAKFQPAVQGC